MRLIPYRRYINNIGKNNKGNWLTSIGVIYQSSIKPIELIEK